MSASVVGDNAADFKNRPAPIVDAEAPQPQSVCRFRARQVGEMTAQYGRCYSVPKPPDHWFLKKLTSYRIIGRCASWLLRRCEQAELPQRVRNVVAALGEIGGDFCYASATGFVEECSALRCLGVAPSVVSGQKRPHSPENVSLLMAAIDNLPPLQRENVWRGIIRIRNAEGINEQSNLLLTLAYQHFAKKEGVYCRLGDKEEANLRESRGLLDNATLATALDNFSQNAADKLRNIFSRLFRNVDKSFDALPAERQSALVENAVKLSEPLLLAWCDQLEGHAQDGRCAPDAEPQQCDPAAFLSKSTAVLLHACGLDLSDVSLEDRAAVMRLFESAVFGVQPSELLAQEPAQVRPEPANRPVASAKEWAQKLQAYLAKRQANDQAIQQAKEDLKHLREYEDVFDEVGANGADRGKESSALLRERCAEIDRMNAADWDETLEIAQQLAYEQEIPVIGMKTVTEVGEDGKAHTVLSFGEMTMPMLFVGPEARPVKYRHAPVSMNLRSQAEELQGTLSRAIGCHADFRRLQQQEHGIVLLEREIAELETEYKAFTTRRANKSLKADCLRKLNDAKASLAQMKTNVQRSQEALNSLEERRAEMERQARKHLNDEEFQE
jgi:hypothetical protein